MVRKIAKILLPRFAYKKFDVSWELYTLKKRFEQAYKYDLQRYLQYSESKREKTRENLIGLIIRRYHVIEKGLTMPETRLGFGKPVLTQLILDCKKFIKEFGGDDDQLIQAVAVISEYKDLHISKNFKLDDELLALIDDIESLKKDLRPINTCPQKEFTLSNYFADTESAFPIFSRSRSSIRNFSNKDIPVEDILDALELAKTAPSACNRQSWRTYLFTDSDKIKAILETQGGNRGFGHLTNKLLVITSEVGVFGGVAERNQAFIDGGIYAMNLLYSLHYKKIAACILNCSTTIEKDLKLRNLCNVKGSEVLIALVACGIPPERFQAAASTRYELDKTNRIL